MGNIVDFNAVSSTTNSLKIKEKNVETKASLEYLSNFWRTIEMPLINCEINLDLNWSKKCDPNQYLNYLIDPSFQEINRLFVLSFEDNAHQTSYNWYFLPNVEIKDYDAMIDGKNLFDQPVKNNLRTCDSIQRLATGKAGNCRTGCLLDYNYFKDYYKMTAIYLSKQQALDPDPKVIQQISFKEDLERYENENTRTFFIVEEPKETVLDFWQGNVILFFALI